jgi:CheY-like chemotaxis protein
VIENQTPSTSAGTPKRPRILVVEDDVHARLLAVEFLTNDYQVLEAGTADEAVTILAENHDVDLVFSDVRMPGTMNGLGLARWVEAHYPSLPVLLVSGYVGTNDEIDGYQPRWPLVAKPYSYMQLLCKIADMLGLRGEGGSVAKFGLQRNS